MKEQNEVDKGGGVRKFRYVGPPKRETLPQQWSQDLNKSSNYSNATKQSYSGLDLDSVWSIKKNVAVDSKAKQSSGQLNSFLPGLRREQNPMRTTFYSRHKTVAANPVQDKNDFLSPSQPTSTKRVWQRGSAQTHSNASSSPVNIPSEDEFDFDLPSKTATKWTNSAPKQSDQSPGISSGLNNFNTDNQFQSNTKPSKYGYNGSNFSNRYNASSFNF